MLGLMVWWFLLSYMVLLFVPWSVHLYYTLKILILFEQKDKYCCIEAVKTAEEEHQQCFSSSDQRNEKSTR